MPALSMLRRKDTPPASTAEAEARVKLAAALTAASAARAESDATARAHAAAQQAVSTARNAIAKATTAVETAATESVRYRIDLARGNATTPPQTVGEAKAAVATAEQHLDDCRAAQDALATELRKARDGVGYRERDVEAAALDVLKTSPVIAKLIEETGRLQRAYYSNALALNWLEARSLLHLGTRSGFGYTDATPALFIVHRWQASPETWNLPAGDDMPGSGAWGAALEALKTDAAAPLPDA
jgi:hypothetical protein